SSENFKEHQNKLSIHRGLFQKDPSTVTSTSSANNLSALGTGSLYNCCGNCCSSGCCSCCCCCCCCCCTGTIDGGGGCCDGNGLALKTGNLSISNSNVRNISTKPLSPQTTSEDFKIYLANIQFLQNASNVLTIAYLRKLHNFFSKTYRKMVASTAASTAAAAQEAFDSGKERTVAARADGSGQDSSTKMMLLHSDSLHHPPVCDDESYDEEHKKMVLKIHQEFWDLPTNYQEKPLVFGSQAKNRYKTILPNEHSRVILDPERAPIAGGEPYINANYIKGPDYANNSYIATQGPLPNTIYEFWLMVYQNVARTATVAGTSLSSSGIEQKIVMLTNFVENGRQKCAIYFPQNEDDWLAFGSTADVDVSEVLQEKDTLTAKSSCPEDSTIRARCDSCFFLVHNACIAQRNGYTVRALNVIYGQKAEPPSEGTKVEETDGGTLFELTAFRAHHYWFPDWPDHRSPNDINVLLDLSLDVLGPNVIDTPRPESNNSLKGNQPGTPGLEEMVSAGQLAALGSAPTPTVLPIIHCSAGIGRTGCLIAILNGLRQLRLSVMAHQRRQQQRKQAQQTVAACQDDPVSDGPKTAADELQDELEQSLPLPPVPDGPEARRKSATSLLTLTAGNGSFRGQRGGEAGTLQRESGQVDILGIVCNLRLQRGGMVQNSEQYELIHRALCLYLEKLTQEGHII
uniref:Tyrosine-protein phosphatase domain-containing protein n=1 Tax=Anopheles maculatus TaxID=74869 RepID=A0A182S5M6_9DIPT